MIVVQARTSSRRLPGKVLLNIRGHPLAALAAMRAGRTGRNVILATSHEPSDDALAATVKAHGIAVVRGPLDDVLTRFADALSGLNDADPVVRLTADNVVPDGDLIDEVVADFLARGLDYLTTSDIASGLPYGCAVEVTRAGHIRAADRHAHTSFEREHVTPWIRARFGATAYTARASLGCGHLRATIDCLDDFETVHRAFPEGVDPVQIGWQELVSRLAALPTRPVVTKPAERMVLGTVQLGMPYGIARQSSPDAGEARQMIKLAITNGVPWIDTASAYGDSEERIGEVLEEGWSGRCRVVTKMSPLPECDSATAADTVRALAEASLWRSCVRLGQRRLDTVLLHRAAHLTAWNGAVWDVLRAHRDEGRITTIGVSVQNAAELEQALALHDLGHIQLPCNILDTRWHDAPSLISAARAQRPLRVHVRSALLQGLLTTEDPDVWHRAHVTDPAPILQWLKAEAARCGQPDVVSLCLSWARSLPFADGVVVGCDTRQQLLATLKHFDAPTLSPDALATIERTRPSVPAGTLDPACWT